MSEKPRERWKTFKHGGWMILILIAITSGWLIFWFRWAFDNGFEMLELNEMGDFLAGVFAPLAFIWFTAAVFFQRNEIRLSTKELRNQVAETARRTAIAQSELELFKGQQEQQQKDAARRKYEEWRSLIPRFALVRDDLDKTGYLHFRLQDTTIREYSHMGKVVKNEQGGKQLEPGHRLALSGADVESSDECMRWTVQVVDIKGGHHTLRLKYHPDSSPKLLETWYASRFDFRMREFARKDPDFKFIEFSSQKFRDD